MICSERNSWSFNVRACNDDIPRASRQCYPCDRMQMFVNGSRNRTDFDFREQHETITIDSGLICSISLYSIWIYLMYFDLFRWFLSNLTHNFIFFFEIASSLRCHRCWLGIGCCIKVCTSMGDHLGPLCFFWRSWDTASCKQVHISLYIYTVFSILTYHIHSAIQWYLLYCIVYSFCGQHQVHIPNMYPVYFHAS